MIVIRNSEGKYFCSSYGMTHYEWRSTSEFDNQVPGPCMFVNRRAAEQHIADSESPKTVRVGSSDMTRPDYPDMSTALVCEE